MSKRVGSRRTDGSRVDIKWTSRLHSSTRAPTLDQITPSSVSSCAAVAVDGFASAGVSFVLRSCALATQCSNHTHIIYRCRLNEPVKLTQKQ